MGAVTGPEPSADRQARLRFTPELTAAVLGARPGADLGGATVLGEGWACEAYRVPWAGGEVALRVPKPRSWWAGADLEREAMLLPALESLGLPVPRGARLLRGGSGTVLGALQSIVPGAPMSDVPARAAPRARFASDVGAFLARLHAVALDGVGGVRTLGVKDVPMWDGHYAPMIERCLGVLPPASARWLADRARAFLDGGGVESSPRVLIHADCSGDHLLAYADGALTGVIDWADAMIGDPVLDFAALLDDYGAPFLEAVLPAYTRAGGSVDPDARRRAAFYVEVAPVFGVLLAEDAGFPEIARADRRRFAARAAAVTRARNGAGR